MERFCHQKEMYEKMYENLLVTSIGESARMQSPKQKNLVHYLAHLCRK